MTDAIVSEEFYDEFHWDDYGSEAPTAATVRYWRYTTAGGKEYLQAGFTFAAGVHDFTATSLGSGGFSFTLATLPTGFQGRRIHREARATGPLASYPVQPWDGYATANDEDDIDAELQLIKDNSVGDFDGATDSLRAIRDENKAEHDTTQSKVDQIGAAAEARLTGPTTFEIPDSGTSTFVLRFVLRDLDQSPSALVDPDSNQVDVTVIDQSGGAPTGVTLAGTPAGRMTRDSAGRYSLVVTVADTAADETQLRFTADYIYLSTSNVALHDTILGDFDQLDRIEANTDTLLVRVGTPGDAIDDPTLFGQHFDTQDDITSEHGTTRALIQAHRDEVEPEIDEIVADIGDETDTSAQPTVFGRLKRGEENVDAEHATTRALVTSEANENQALIEDIQAGSRILLSWSAVGDAGDEGGRFRASVAITDSVAGDITSANIDISTATVTLEQSRAGAAFSTTGITQPTVTKANGLVTVDFDLVGSEWKTGDVAHLLLRGVKATDSSATARFLPANSWTFQVNAAGGFEGSFGG